MGHQPKKGADATRAERKFKKRKLEAAIPDIPGENDDTTEVVDVERGLQEQVGKRKRRKLEDGTPSPGEEGGTQSKRAKKAALRVFDGTIATRNNDTLLGHKSSERQQSTGNNDEEIPLSPSAALLISDNPRKSKKERKAERKAKEASAATNRQPLPIAEPVHSPNVSVAAKVSEEKSGPKNNRNREKTRKVKAEKVSSKHGENVEVKAPRFIVFIGNLPFSATKESISKHFAAVKPKAVRHLTQKDNPTKSKGIAFIEFDGYDHMKTCLKLFHHSSFDDGVSPARKINVELTAGGGGNTKERREKIREKNTKLNDQRSRRIQEEEKSKWEKKMDSGPASDTGVHPSRRGQVVGT